jgi:hypothetical protein
VKREPGQIEREIVADDEAFGFHRDPPHHLIDELASGVPIEPAIAT